MKQATLSDLFTEEQLQTLRADNIYINSFMIYETPIAYLPLYLISSIASKITFMHIGFKQEPNEFTLFRVSDAIVIMEKLAMDKKLSLYAISGCLTIS